VIGPDAGWVVLLAVLGSALFAGCALQPAHPPLPSEGPQPAQPPQSAPQRPRVNLSGYPAEFRQGHADGCTSATSTRVRDEGRMKGDASYAQGWQDGYDLCSRRR